MASERQKSSFDDEISLKELFLKLWHKRGLLVALPILAAMASVVFVLAQVKDAKTSTVYHIHLTAVDKGFYPNGVGFSPQDVKAPQVLKEVAARSKTGDLSDAVMVSYANPATKGILQKYEAKLAQKGINAAQIDALNAQLQDEITTATQRTLRISIDHERLGLSPSQGGDLAILLPQVWSEIYLTKFRILDDTKISDAILPETLSLTSTLGIIEARSVISNILVSLSIIESDNRLRSLMSTSGMTATDLRSRFSSLNDIYINGVLSTNIAAGDALAKVYLSNTIYEVEKLIEELDGTDELIGSLQQVMSADVAEEPLSSQAPNNPIQLQGDAIEHIAALVNRSALAEYLTSLYERKAHMIGKIADLKFQVRKVEEGIGFGPELISDAEKRLNVIVEEYSSLLSRARDMNLRAAGELHQAFGSPYTTGSKIPPRAPWIILLSTVLGGFVAVIVALLLPMRRKDGL